MNERRNGQVTKTITAEAVHRYTVYDNHKVFRNASGLSVLVAPKSLETALVTRLCWFTGYTSRTSETYLVD